MTINKRVLTFISSDKCIFSQTLHLQTRKAHCPPPVPPRKINRGRRKMNPPRTVLDLDPDQKGIFYIIFHFDAIFRSALTVLYVACSLLSFKFPSIGYFAPPPSNNLCTQHFRVYLQQCSCTTQHPSPK